MFTNTHTRARRGVVLLLILALMAMFGMVVLAFVLTSRHAQGTARAYQRVDEQAILPEEQLDQAALQVLRGSRSRKSGMRQHGLMEDVYGSGTVHYHMVHGKWTVGADTTLPPNTRVEGICSGQLIAFTPAHRVKNYGIDPPPTVYRLIADPATGGNPYQFVGRVLTMREGLAVGRSTRIVGYDPHNNVLLILPFEGVTAAAFVNEAHTSTLGYIVNGPAFSGTGFGYDSDNYSTAGSVPSYALDAPLNVFDPLLTPLAPLPYVLLPNRTGDPTTPSPAGDGHANEDYDAVDLQNLVLAMMEADGNVPIPTLHRPALLNFWYHYLVANFPWPADYPDPVMGGDPEVDKWKAVLQPVVYLSGSATKEWARDQILAIKRRIFFRPLVDLNGYFRAGNPLWYAWETLDLETAGSGGGPMTTLAEVRDDYWLTQGVPLHGPWDVDNDGDGRTDSIWVDLGMPIQTSDDGRRFKPLFAVLCTDLDGRLNINANGCLAQALVDSSGVSLYGQPVDASPLFFAAGGASMVPLPRGQGNGPPEVNLRAVLDDNYWQYRALLMGRDMDPDTSRERWLDGRYGEAASTVAVRTVQDTDGDLLPDDFRYVAPGESFVPADRLRTTPTMLYANDPLSRNQHFEFDQLASYSFGNATAYGTPPDFKGSMPIGLDVRGQPIYWPMADPAVNSDYVVGGTTYQDGFAWPSVNDPYELNLSRNSARALSTPAPTDHPFSVFELEKILRRYDFDVGELPQRLQLLAPNLFNHRNEITTESWDWPGPSAALVRDAPSLGATSGVSYRRIAHFSQLLRSKLRPPIRTQPAVWINFAPHEMLAGLRMDLNRPFGNGVDDNSNGVVDEPGLIVWRSGAGTPAPPPQFMFYSDGGGTPSGLDAPSEVADVTDPDAPFPIEMVPLVDAAGTLAPVLFDHSNGVDVDFDGNDLDADDVPDWDRVAVDRAMARQLYARYLYMLAILVCDEVYDEVRSGGAWDAARLAQWAVNVVDFRDRDSIMTRFDYDPYPLDGWTPTQIVWGCERPELLISETLATHDHRSEDLAADGGLVSASADTHTNFDQRIHPQGSLFVELFNPWTDLEHLPGEFCYDRSAGSFSSGVMLDQTAPNGDPVWRMLVAIPEGDPADEDLSDGAVFDPRDPDEPTLAPADVERSVYFVEPSGAYADGAALQYYPTDPDTSTPENLAPIMPGRYAVIGPGDAPGSGSTPIGFQVADTDLDGGSGEEPRRIELAADPDPTVGQVDVYANSLTVSDVDSIPRGAQPAVAVVMDAVTSPPSGRTVPRFSVSEPTNGYPVYPDPSLGEFSPPLDEPLDKTVDADLWDWPDPDTGFSQGTRYRGTNRRYRVIYLQRLANPLAPWDGVYNPFLTVDSMQVDLTVFNGVTGASDPEVLVADHDQFYAVQRGGDVSSGSAPAEEHNNIWIAERERDAEQAPWTPPRDIESAPGGEALFHYGKNFAHTLGRLNAWYGAPLAAAGRYLGDPDDDLTSPSDGPFPWLTWLNRPFVNQMELLLVPNRRSSQLLRRFSIGRETADPYAPTDLNPDPSDVPTPHNPLSFQHLAPFLGTPPPDSRFTPTLPPRAARLHRLLDYVHVPSRFVGTELQANPAVFNGWWPPAAAPVPLLAPFNFPYRPPFHGISNYREPGRVNINTAFSRNVWNGLSNYFEEMTGIGGLGVDHWQTIMASRRGYAGTLDPAFPTQFANPFRSFAGAQLVPLPHMRQAVGSSLPSQVPPGNGDGIHATMLRGGSIAGGPPMLRYQANLPTDAYENTARNPYFRNQLLQRLAGVTTTRSNVYATWITVGYFEVVTAPSFSSTGWTLAEYQAVYPEGYQLGPELGSETGEIERHRAFYIFDRSIPVGFQRGRDHNVRDAILLERFIE